MTSPAPLKPLWGFARIKDSVIAISEDGGDTKWVQWLKAIRLVRHVADDYEAALLAAAQREQALRQQVAELLDMLERRQRCEECGGSGAVSFWHHDEDGGYDSLEPCECWSDAEDLIAKYEQAKGANDDE